MNATPPSRVLLEPTLPTEIHDSVDPIVADPRYHQATVMTNRRITSSDWYQDVRHLEFDFQDDIKYEPGDVAVIHPIAESGDVQSLLELVQWSDKADTPFRIRRNVEGEL